MIEDFYDSNVTIKSLVLAQNAMGGPIKTWETRVSNLSCRLTQKRVNETNEFGKKTVRNDWIMYCTANVYTLQIKESDRISYGNRIFEVIGIRNPGMQNHHLEIDLMEIR